MRMNTGLSFLRNPWSTTSEFRREFERLFDDDAAPQTFVPACEVEDCQDHYLLTLEMAGIRKDDIKLEIEDGQLTVSGERRHETSQREESQWYSERQFGKFHRSFAIPAGIDTGKVEASYQDGILRVTIPKAESAKPRQIKIANSAGGSKFDKLLSQSKESHPSNEYKTVAS
jgi:HSP20 family protein